MRAACPDMIPPCSARTLGRRGPRTSEPAKTRPDAASGGPPQDRNTVFCHKKTLQDTVSDARRLLTETGALQQFRRPRATALAASSATAHAKNAGNDPMAGT